MSKGFTLDANCDGEYSISFKRDENDLELLMKGISPSTGISHKTIIEILDKYGLVAGGSTTDKQQVLDAVRELNTAAGINN